MIQALTFTCKAVEYSQLLSFKPREKVSGKMYRAYFRFSEEENKPGTFSQYKSATTTGNSDSIPSLHLRLCVMTSDPFLPRHP